MKSYKKYRFILTVIGVILMSVTGWLIYKNQPGVVDFIIRDKTESVNIQSESLEIANFFIQIPKIEVTAPVIQGVDPTDRDNYNKELKRGVALMSGSPLPGDKGNIFIYGHSSALEKSDYDKIFSRLNELEKGDTVLLSYKDVLYNYVIENKRIVEKNDLSVLEQSKEEILTLMTCWPIGTDEKRLVVEAKRIE